MSALNQDTVKCSSSTEDNTEAFDKNKGVFNTAVSKQEVIKHYNEWAENGEYDQNDDEALDKAKGVYKTALSKQEVAQYYSEWAENGKYNQHLNPSRYTGPEVTAKHVADFFPESERPNVRILDVAAGTGYVGRSLHKNGFRLIDALDPSEGMLAKARATGVYSNLFQDFIGGDHRVPVGKSTYDAITCVGGFGDGHIPASALHEMIRIVRSGGIICICLREEYFYASIEYQTKLQPLIEQLQEARKLKLISKKTFDNFFAGKTGLIFKYVVL